MTEREWLTGTTRTLIRYLQPVSVPLGLLAPGFVPERVTPPPIATTRKLRLFCCACCELLKPVLNDTEQTVHHLNELLADGRCTEEEVDAVVATNPRPFFDTYVENSADPSDYAREAVCDCRDAVEDAAHLAFIATRMFTGIPDRTVDFSEDISQRPLLHCIFPNPFRPVAVDPTWLRWNDGAIPRIAQAIYDERRFADLPVLADALEEAGCTSADILEHCRGTGPHVRGCWVVDLVLEKE